MGLLQSRKSNRSCAVCGAAITEKSPVDDLCVSCFQGSVYLSNLLNYLQNTSLDKLNIIQNASVRVSDQGLPKSEITLPTNSTPTEEKRPSPQEPKTALPRYSVLRNSTGEKFILFDQINKIGKSSEMSDIVIANNNTLSRCHAVLEKTSAGIVLWDCGSKNGTRIGSTKLLPEQKVMLKVGDVFSLSNELLTLIVE